MRVFTDMSTGIIALFALQVLHSAEPRDPDPEAIYIGRCTMCHNLGVLAPT